jgi:predicted nucleic-acid-binding protein
LLRDIGKLFMDNSLVDDTGQPEQVKIARRYVKKEGVVFIPQVVQVETVWVLEFAYKLAREQIFPVLEHLDNNAAFTLQNSSSFQRAMRQYIKGNADFSDYRILAESQQQDLKLLTFDIKLGKQAGVILAR